MDRGDGEDDTELLGLPQKRHSAMGSFNRMGSIKGGRGHVESGGVVSSSRLERTAARNIAEGHGWNGMMAAGSSRFDKQ